MRAGVAGLPPGWRVALAGGPLHSAGYAAVPAASSRRDVPVLGGEPFEAVSANA
jgi:hypothetical protein